MSTSRCSHMVSFRISSSSVQFIDALDHIPNEQNVVREADAGLTIDFNNLCAWHEKIGREEEAHSNIIEIDIRPKTLHPVLSLLINIFGWTFGDCIGKPFAQSFEPVSGAIHSFLLERPLVVHVVGVNVKAKVLIANGDFEGQVIVESIRRADLKLESIKV